MIPWQSIIDAAAPVEPGRQRRMRQSASEFEQIVAAMRRYGIAATYVTHRDAGHALGRPENRRSFKVAAEAFLAAHLSGRREPALSRQLTSDRGRSRADVSGRSRNMLSACLAPPDVADFVPHRAIGVRGHQVSARMEVAMDKRVSRKAASRLFWRFDSLYLARSTPCRTMGVLGSIVQISALPMFNLGRELAVCHPVASKFVDRDRPRHILKVIQRTAESSVWPPLRPTVAERGCRARLPPDPRPAKFNAGRPEFG